MRSFTDIYSDLKDMSNYKHYLDTEHFYSLDSKEWDDNCFLKYRELRYLNELSKIPYYRTLTSSSKFFRPVILFVKRIIRKFNKFLIEPALYDISVYNKTGAAVTEKLFAYVKSVEHRCISLEAENQKLRQDVIELKKILQVSSENKSLGETNEHSI